jgi:hypothetical protein
LTRTSLQPAALSTWMTSRELRTEPVYNLSVVGQDLLRFPSEVQRRRPHSGLRTGPTHTPTCIRLDGCARIFSKSTLPGWLAHVHRCATPLAVRQSAERSGVQLRGPERSEGHASQQRPSSAASFAAASLDALSTPPSKVASWLSSPRVRVCAWRHDCSTSTRRRHGDSV